ncbi:unnamed protein product [Phytophthora lilii]|uniref:Unnamed protein product n=1 Tax=Phytophthora lilii TaxID=2077276 RepID=A0A9W6WTV7_9STRA|nr:unnamed protein product [Phytophthora lilii]
MKQSLLSLLPIVLTILRAEVYAAACTDEEDQAISSAYTTAASTSECSDYSVSDLLITIMPPCSATACVSIVKQLAESIPNCTTGSISEKDLLLNSIEICATPAPIPVSTASSTNCTSSQAEDTFNAFYEAANGTCASSTTIEAYSIIVDTPCISPCATAVQQCQPCLAALQLPMKTFALIAVLAAATLDWTMVQAAECSADDLDTISTVYGSAMTEGTAACPDMTSATDATATDYCANSDCMKFMSDMLDQLPDCSSGGVNLKEGLQAALDYCESGTADTSDIFTDTSSSAAFASASSSALATASSSSSSLLRTSAPSTDSTSDKVTANTIPPATGSSDASSISLTFATTAISAATMVFTVAL